MKCFQNKQLICIVVMVCVYVGCTDNAIQTQVGSNDEGNWLDGKVDGFQSNDNYVRYNPLEHPHPTATGIYELIPGRYNDAMSLPDLIRIIDDRRDRESIVYGFLSVVAAHTGIVVELPDIDEILQTPELFTDMLQFDLALLDQGRQALLGRYEGSFKSPKYGYQLPQIFDADSLSSTSVELPSSEMREIITGVYRGWPRNPERSDEFIRQNTILSEIIERLSVNYSAPETELFTLIYEGTSYSDLGTFVNALIENGHTIRAEVRHNVADFAGLHAKGTDGEIYNVAAAGFNRTRVFNSEGIEAVLPMFHSEIAFQIVSSDETQGVAIEGGTVFYQGVSRIGFYCNDCQKRQSWAGFSISDVIEGEEAVKALVFAGHLTDTIRYISLQQGLPVDGYAVTGVCNDSAAIVHAAASGRVYSYPLMMMDVIVLPELESRIANTEGDAEVQGAHDAFVALRDAIRRIPSDIHLIDSTRERAIRSFPWEIGREPFYSSEDARQILNQ